MMSRACSPKRWGPAYWTVLFCLASTYDSSRDKRRFDMYFRNLLIPCPVCQGHYRTWLRERPLEMALSSKSTLNRWLSDLRTEIARRNGKLSSTNGRRVRKRAQ
jgi:hypothetical protein